MTAAAGGFADTKRHYPSLDGLRGVAATFAACVALAWLLLKYYDEPVRAWLTRRWMDRKPAVAVPATNG
ncbi:hypothetical protein [Massilia sp.]|uniref:hypothetical protein n=1 Tax=Massilia sp. TaxID=1882437 RepID=UPI00352E6CFD